MTELSLSVPADVLSDVCRRWRVLELSLFGSVLRDDFGPTSDIDCLVRFDEDAPWSAWDLLDFKEELQQVFGREVDLVEERSLENPYRRRSILRSKRTLYVAD